MNQMKVGTSVLNGRRVGHFIDLVTLGSDETRITIARDGLQELFDAANDGKTVVFTVKIGNKKSVKSAVMKFVG